MSRGSRVLKTTAIYFIGNFASKLLTFFLLPLYTAYLTKNDFGQVDLWLSMLPLIAPIFTLQTTETVFRFLCSNNANIKDKKCSITTSLFVFLLGTAVFILMYIPFVLGLKVSYSILFLIYFISTYVGVFLQQILRGLQRSIEYAVTGVIATIVQATLNILFIVKFNMGGESLLISSISASLIITLIIAVRIKIWDLIDFKLVSKLEIKRQLRYGIPLIPNQISWWAIGVMGKYILLYFYSPSENGILAVASKFPGLVTTISSIFFLAWTENIIKEFESEDRDAYFKKGFELFSKFNFSSTACLLPIIKIYNIMTIGGDFFDAWKYIPILIIGALFNSLSTFLGTIYTASMKTKDALTTTVISGLTNLILSILMTPFISIWGIVLANTLSFIVLFIARIRSVKKIIKFRVEFKNDSISSIAILIISLMVYWFNGIALQMIFFVIFLICTLIINKEIIMEILKVIGVKKKICDRNAIR